MSIDVGNKATDSGYAGWTVVDKANPANASGKIISIEIWADTNMENCEVATFYRPDPSGFPNKLTTRDTYAIGNVTADSKQNFIVDLNVVEGDYIGIYNSAGAIEVDLSGGSGLWILNGDYISCTNETFGSEADNRISLYALGVSLPIDIGNVAISRASNGWLCRLDCCR